MILLGPLPVDRDTGGLVCCLVLSVSKPTSSQSVPGKKKIENDIGMALRGRELILI